MQDSSFNKSFRTLVSLGVAIDKAEGDPTYVFGMLTERRVAEFVGMLARNDIFFSYGDPNLASKEDSSPLKAKLKKAEDLLRRVQDQYCGDRRPTSDMNFCKTHDSDLPCIYPEIQLFLGINPHD